MTTGRPAADERTSEALPFIDDSPNLTMMEIRAKARRLRQKANLKLIVVDYLQLMTRARSMNRGVEVSEFSRHLKLLAKELGGSRGRDQPAQPWGLSSVPDKNRCWPTQGIGLPDRVHRSLRADTGAASPSV